MELYKNSKIKTIFVLFYHLNQDFILHIHAHFKNLKKNEIIATTEHGIEVISIIAKNNIYGTQFHPKKP